MATEGSSDGIPMNNNSEGNQQVKATRLRKEPWTPQEDQILNDYVLKNGPENWDVVQKNSGLNRCRKSCRLRWFNHLRPNLKKCPFSAEEEALIAHLHFKIGNKWAKMAVELPGRTDNEIKNFWNTRMKKRKRVNLPMYRESERKETLNYRPSAPMISNNHEFFSDTFNSSRTMTTLAQQQSVEQFNNMSYVTNNNINQIYIGFHQNNNNNNYSSAFTEPFDAGFTNNNYISYSVPALPTNHFIHDESFNLSSDLIQIGSQTYDQTGYQDMYTTKPGDDIFIQSTNHFIPSESFNFCSDLTQTLFGSQTYDQTGYQGMYTTKPGDDIFIQHSNANNGGYQGMYTTKPSDDIFIQHSNANDGGYQGMYTTKPSDDIFIQHSNANDGFLEDIVNQVKTLEEKTKNNCEVNQSNVEAYLWDYKIMNEGPIKSQDPLVYGGQQAFILDNHFLESSFSGSSMGTNIGTSSMEENAMDYGFLNSFGIYPETGGTMLDLYNIDGPVPTVESLTTFNSVQTPMGYQEELFNSSNSMAMKSSQPYLENSNHQNIIPGDLLAFNGNVNDISGFQW